MADDLQRYYNEVFKQDVDPEWSELPERDKKIIESSLGFIRFRAKQSFEVAAINVKRWADNLINAYSKVNNGK
ncbi:hypothetical protein [Gracilimonas sediminicola]|uniref:Uncharacterized protein n=1 Tax=Gracilimonas sediminicola TaxID=2952158 RepID=A0A9X2L0H8_9BACT|nr:hypothetical protein [Gracilimonas sediminicola]MCP9289999.1 hypothetical protein [Gracilimonas sediminicola]